MSFTEVNNSIYSQPAIGAFGFTASGNIYKGQGVYICSSNKVCVPSTDDKRFLGISMYNASNDDKVAIYCVGNLVTCKISGTTTPTAGTFVGVVTGGYVSPNATHKSGAVITRAASTNYGDGDILIIGTEYNQ